jgi:hypothetical protein
MAVTSRSIRDWTYREAQRRLHRAGQSNLPNHSAQVRLDAAANRVVDCRCGWIGNGLGWLAHLDSVVSGALSD